MRPVVDAARCAIAGLVLAALAWTARAVWEIRLAAAGQPASGPPDQGDGRHRQLTALEDGYNLVSSMSGAAAALCAIMFLLWLSRVRENARALSGERPRYAWIWLYAGWVLPIANLWIPRGIIADIHRASAPGRRLPRSVNWWWGLWLVGMLSGVGLMSTDSRDEIIARAYTDVPALLASDAVVVGAAVAGVLVVRAVTAAQRERMDGV
ncbi:DUF4328 domain-containing protein [Streptomyces sp. NPDC050619]|uniref:DUF4328 domain-containing protein n=1 Tax=Streptomyces sp. NPDC050619 TaxID=3157214 RepID=UPI0034192340